MISRLQSIFLDAWWGGGLGIAAGGWDWEWEWLNGMMKPGGAEWKGLWDKDVYYKLSQEIKICEQKKNWRHKNSLQFLKINTEFGIKKQLATLSSRLIAAWKQRRKTKLLSTHTPQGGDDAKWLDRLLFGVPERERKEFEMMAFFLSSVEQTRPSIRPQTPHKEEEKKSNQKKKKQYYI